MRVLHNFCSGCNILGIEGYLEEIVAAVAEISTSGETVEL